MALFVVLVVGLYIASVFVTPVELLMSKSPEVGHSEAEAAAFVDEISRSDQFVDVVRWVTGSDEAQVRYLLQEKPALLSVIWVVLLIAFPFITCIGSFNQTAGDIGSRGLRYLLLRTERVNVFFGRFVGTLVFAACSVAFMMVLLIVYIGVKFNIYPLMDMVLWGLQGYAALMLISLPYVAMCSWMSALLDSPWASLALCLLLTGFPVAIFNMADATITTVDLDWLLLLLPWGWKYELLSSDVLARLLAYGVMLGFTGFFLFLGLRTFSRRDL